jgi:hypothetical protein
MHLRPTVASADLRYVVGAAMLSLLLWVALLLPLLHLIG